MNYQVRKNLKLFQLKNLCRLHFFFGHDLNRVKYIYRSN